MPKGVFKHPSQCGFQKGHIPWNKKGEKIIKTCLNCDKRFKIYPHQEITAKFCSIRCKGLWRSKHWRGKNNPFYGRKHIEEANEKNRKAHTGKKASITTRKKMSESHKGKKHPMLNFIPHNKGKKGLYKHSEKTKQEMSEARLGENHWNWKNGITPLRTKIWKDKEYQYWRNFIFKKDNYTCQKCGRRNGDHRAHHIFNFSQYPELRFNTTNGITFCKNCHDLFHKIYGYQNNNRKQVEMFLKSSNIQESIQESIYVANKIGTVPEEK